MSPAASHPVTLADLVPVASARGRAALMVVLFVAASAIGAQLSLDLGGTPAPITCQSLFVLLAGAVLGARLGAASQVLSFAVGAAGLPVFSRGEHGWDAATGWRFGYLVGFVAAAAVVGALAERGKDRSFGTSALAMIVGTAFIYAFGVSWLAYWSNIPLYDPAAPTDAMRQAVRPFILGDVVKLLVAAAVVTVAWRLHGRTAGVVAQPARTSAPGGQLRPASRR